MIGSLEDLNKVDKLARQAMRLENQINALEAHSNNPRLCLLRLIEDNVLCDDAVVAKVAAYARMQLTDHYSSQLEEVKRQIRGWGIKLP
jgi:hypothetical protein